MSRMVLRNSTLQKHVYMYNYMQLHKHKEGGTLSQEFGFMIIWHWCKSSQKRIGQGTIAVHIKSAPCIML